MSIIIVNLKFIQNISNLCCVRSGQVFRVSTYPDFGRSIIFVDYSETQSRAQHNTILTYLFRTIGTRPVIQFYNTVYTLGNDGRIVAEIGVSLKASCRIDLTEYPNDNQSWYSILLHYIMHRITGILINNFSLPFDAFLSPQSFVQVSNIYNL